MDEPAKLNLPFEFVPIDTERLRLRHYRLDDLDALHSWRSREDVTRYQDYDVQTREESQRSLERATARVTMAVQGDGFVWAIERRDDGQVIGDIILFLDSIEHALGEIGWTLHPDYQGKGYATEAARGVMKLAFETIGMHRIKANLDPRNHASEALCLRLGMRREAHYVEDFWSKGEWTDSYIYAILAREWRANQ
ncbi:MAG: GNAT family N-acetyltransferase [Thermomicrobiales bacterium]|nr:GNAT family N-acetyltransferase [Thermomicrobiales bacterium]